MVKELKSSLRKLRETRMRRNSYSCMHIPGSRIFYTEGLMCAGSMGRDDLEEGQCGWRSEKRVDPRGRQEQVIQGFAGHDQGIDFILSVMISY